jgi:hypothetical protein
MAYPVLHGGKVVSISETAPLTTLSRIDANEEIARRATTLAFCKFVVTPLALGLVGAGVGAYRAKKVLGLQTLIGAGVGYASAPLVVSAFSALSELVDHVWPTTQRPDPLGHHRITSFCLHSLCTVGLPFQGAGIVRHASGLRSYRRTGTCVGLLL